MAIAENTNTKGATVKYPILPARLVDLLSEGGYSPTQVSQMLGGRISFRALYRWRREEAMPQRFSDYLDVLHLAQGLGLLPPPESPLSPALEIPEIAPKVQSDDVDDVDDVDDDSFRGSVGDEESDGGEE